MFFKLSHILQLARDFTALGCMVNDVSCFNFFEYKNIRVDGIFVLRRLR